MKEHKLSTSYSVYESKAGLPAPLKALFTVAEIATEKSYAPYSNFKVGAALELENGAIISAGNQENAAYPVCLCAEGGVLAAASSQYPGVAIRALAVTAFFKHKIVEDVAAPCGLCRQTIKEYQSKQKTPIKLLFSGKYNSIYVVEHIDALLPFGFDGGHLH